MDETSCRDFGPMLRRSLYNEAVHRGWIKYGDELRVDVRRACVLYGITRNKDDTPTLSQGKRVLRILQWIRDHPDEAWSVDPVMDRRDLQLYIRPGAPHAHKRGAGHDDAQNPGGIPA